MRLRSPIAWFGGKARLASKILPLFPDDHRIYVEPCGGAANLLIAKQPSCVEVYNDLNEGLVSLFRVLRDPELFQRFYHYALFTPYSRAEWKACRRWRECKDPAVKAYQWFILLRQGFGGHDHSWGRTVTSSSRGMAGSTSSWLGILDQLPAIHHRLMRVQVESKDCRSIIKDYDTADTLFYIDPPYIPDTRRDGKYEHEMSMEDHMELHELLLSIKGKAILSGYAHRVHEQLESRGWKRLDFPAACTITGRTRDTRNIARAELQRTESVWISPRCQS